MKNSSLCENCGCTEREVFGFELNASVPVKIFQLQDCLIKIVFSTLFRVTAHGVIFKSHRVYFPAGDHENVFQATFAL